MSMLTEESEQKLVYSDGDDAVVLDLRLMVMGRERLVIVIAVVVVMVIFTKVIKKGWE